MEDEVKSKIFDIIKECSAAFEGWAKQSKVCSECIKQGINLKSLGGAKVVFSQLTEQIEISRDEANLPVLRMRSCNESDVKMISDGNVTLDKKGLSGLGRIANQSAYLNKLQSIIGYEITSQDIEQYINSDEFKLSFYGKDGKPTDEQNAYYKKFKLPYTDKNHGSKIIGEFKRDELDGEFVGVTWCQSISVLFNYGKVNPETIQNLRSISANKDVDDIVEHIVGEIEYLNQAGYKEFPDGTTVNRETGKFIFFETNLKTQSGETICGWFSRIPTPKEKQKILYEGIFWGSYGSFKSLLSNRKKFKVGRMLFDSQDLCNEFFDELAGASMKEPWEYKNRKDENFNKPILKSYLEHELNRLFYESEQEHRDKKIIFNKKGTHVLFNTNLLDRYGNDIFIVGAVVKDDRNQVCISKLRRCNKEVRLGELGFDRDSRFPAPPEFFKDVNEIVFHSDWRIENDYEHIIGERKPRFPENYKDSSEITLGNKLASAIEFARKIAQRNYKFIVPMYYPRKHRIQLLMPIYLELDSNSLPDFALVLTPSDNSYIPETILELEEVYQDARLIAKPDESWLNPEFIK